MEVKPRGALTLALALALALTIYAQAIVGGRKKDEKRALERMRLARSKVTFPSYHPYRERSSGCGSRAAR